VLSFSGRRLKAEWEFFEGWWKKVLEDGVLPDTASQSVIPGEPELPEIKPI